MSVFSNAIGNERIERVLGYKIAKDNSNPATVNKPVRIAVLCEANTDNQGAETSPPTDITEKFAATNAVMVGKKFGFGSPAYLIADQLFPVGGGRVGGIPVDFYVQSEAGGASAQEKTITVTGTATANVTHTVIIEGYGSVTTGSYDINIQKDDTEDDIAEKIQTAVANVLGCPYDAALNSPVDNDVNFTSKWKGLTANDLTLSVETYGKPAGITYLVTDTADGAGTPDINASLAMFSTIWYDYVINSYGTVESVMDKLELFNGVADPDNPTGRYRGDIMRPFKALTGSVADDPSSITDERLDEMTICICPGPKSKVLPMRLAAAMCELDCRIAQDTPHLDVAGMSYRNIPVPKESILMSDYNERDAMVRKGCSTVDIVAGKYQVQSFVTTYHPEGEVPWQFNFVRLLTIDWNVYYTYYLLELLYAWNHVLAGDKDVVSAVKVIKPKEWAAIVGGKLFAENLVSRALITDAAYLKASIQCGISTSNPDRLATRFRYKRTGFGRILDTTAEAGFALG